MSATPSRVVRALAPLLAAMALASACSRTDGRLSPPALPPVSPIGPIDPVEEPIVQVVERVRPAVVNVTTSLASSESLTGGEGRGTGTGFVVRADGVVVTNFHVVEGGLSIRVVTEEGESLDARVIGGDPDADLAILQVDAEDPLPAVQLGDSEELKLGQQLVAIGFPLALEGGPSVTTGIVSSLSRTIQVADQNLPSCERTTGQGCSRTYEDLIQTDAAINPGNSGGPLVDMSGRVIGINTAGVEAASAENIGFAIAINRARPIIEEAIENPAAPAPYMGVSTQAVDAVVAAQYQLPVERGVLVLDVDPGGPSDRAGIEPGDVIIGLDGRLVQDGEDLREIILGHQPGEDLEVAFVRGETKAQTLTVRLGVRPFPVAG